MHPTLNAQAVLLFKKSKLLEVQTTSLATQLTLRN